MLDVTATLGSGHVLVAAAIALVAGLISFASPCVLPLVPGFLGYVTGLGGAPLAQRSRGRVVLGAGLFVLGFSAVYMTMVLLASVLGVALRSHTEVLTRLGGLVVIALGLVFLGWGGGRWQSSWQTGWRPAAGLVGAPLLGAVFALGWAPCSGPTLGVILALATNLSGDSAMVTRGAILGAAYCLGLGVPFLLIAAGWTRAQRASAWLRQHHRGVQLLGGALLVAVGALLVTGIWTSLMQSLQTSLVGPFRTVL